VLGDLFAYYRGSMKKLGTILTIVILGLTQLCLAETAPKKQPSANSGVLKKELDSSRPTPGNDKKKPKKKKVKKVKKVRKKPVKKEIVLIRDKKDKTPEELLQKFYEAYKFTWNFQARYKQKVFKPERKEDDPLSIKSTGKIFVQRPSWKCKTCWRVMWNIDTPVRFKLITNRKTVWLYNAISQTVRIQAFKQMNPGSQFVMNLILGRYKLKKIYNVKKSLESKNKIILTPKKKSKLKQIEAELDPISFWAKNLKVETVNGTIYEMSFSSVQRNIPELLEMDNIFSKRNIFIVPAGVIRRY